MSKSWADKLLEYSWLGVGEVTQDETHTEFKLLGRLERLAYELGLGQQSSPAFDFDQAIQSIASLPWIDAIAPYKTNVIPDQELGIALNQISTKWLEISEHLIALSKKDEFPKIVLEDDPYLRLAKLYFGIYLMTTHILNLDDRSKTIFPSSSVLWGCILVEQCIFELEVTNIFQALGISDQSNLEHSKSKILEETRRSCEILQIPKDISGNRIVCDYLVSSSYFHDAIVAIHNNQTPQSKFHKIYDQYMRLNRALGNTSNHDSQVVFYWLDADGKMHQTSKKGRGGQFVT